MATCALVHGAYQGGWIWKPVAQRLTGHYPMLSQPAELAGLLTSGVRS